MAEMVGTLMGGAAIGALFGELLKKVMKMRNEAVTFKKTLKNLESTLRTLYPTVMELVELNNYLDRPKQELMPIRIIMEDGMRVVEECSRIRSLNLRARFRYRGKLNELGSKVKDFFTIELPGQIAKDVKESSIRMASYQDEILRKLQMIHDAAAAAHTGDIATGPAAAVART